MRLRPCSSCDRPVAAGESCPFCGAPGEAAAYAPRAAAALLCVPLLAASCTEKSVSPPEPAYGAPAEVVPPEPPAGGNEAEPKDPTKADPTPPSEPQNEIYGTPEMIDERLEEKPEPSPPKK